MSIISKLLKTIIPLLLMVSIASATIVGVMFILSVTGQLTYSSTPIDFTVVDGDTGDAITYNKVGDSVFIQAPIYANKQNVIYYDVLKVTALRNGTLSLQNASRTSNGITKLEVRFYDFQNGTDGYNWVEIPTFPTAIGLGMFNQSQILIMQMRINTGTNTSSGEVILFDMKMN